MPMGGGASIGTAPKHRDDGSASDPAAQASTPLEELFDVPATGEYGDDDMDDRVDQQSEQRDDNDVDMAFVWSVEAAQGIGNLEPSEDDAIAELLVTQMGGSGRQCRGYYSRAARKIVFESDPLHVSPR